jgi:hypothetical protein
MHTPATAEHLTEDKTFKLLTAFVNEKPDLEPGNYYNPADLTSGRRTTYWDGRRAFAQEARSISKDGTRARKALAEAKRYPFNAAAMLDASQRAFSGRLSFIISDGKLGIDYTAGQYYPTEYRKAAAAVLEQYCSVARPKLPPQPSDVFYHIGDIERAADRAGSHFFDRDSKRFFRSRILEGIHKGSGRLIWFVTSEKRGFDDARRGFTVRVFDTTTGSVDTPGDFNGHSTAAQAHSAARKLAARDQAGEHTGCGLGRSQCEFCGHYAESCTAAQDNAARRVA